MRIKHEQIHYMSITNHSEEEIRNKDNVSNRQEYPVTWLVHKCVSVFFAAYYTFIHTFHIIFHTFHFIT